MNRTFVDVHHHILFGLDDGPKNSEGMKAMIDAACADEVRHIIATPHVTPGVAPFDKAAWANALAQANAYCAEKGYALRILGGAEIMYTEAAVRMLTDGQIPTLAGTRFVLVEWPSRTPLPAVTGAIRNLANAGFIPVMAHVERLRCFQGQLDRLRQLKDDFDVRVQIDADAIPEHTPLFSRSTVPHLLRSGLADYVASDAHDTEGRRIQMKTAYLRIRQRYGEELAVALTETHPMEIINAATEEVQGSGL